MAFKCCIYMLCSRRCILQGNQIYFKKSIQTGANYIFHMSTELPCCFHDILFSTTCLLPGKLLIYQLLLIRISCCWFDHWCRLLFTIPFIHWKIIVVQMLCLYMHTQTHILEGKVLWLRGRRCQTCVLKQMLSLETSTAATKSSCQGKVPGKGRV